MDKQGTDKPEQAGTVPHAQPKTVINAGDTNRNDERDERIGAEPDTKRLRSERESATGNEKP